MVFNLCMPHFNTTVHCNKLCADGYDVTNLVSADPAVRRRGFKLEYFMRPPVQVTLTFDFKVELCRVDVELWQWGMDRGQACKKLEISTSSGSLSSCDSQPRDNHDNSQKKYSKPPQSNGHHCSVQAQNWGRSEPQSNTESANANTNEFKLVGRCELREETKVCFTHSHFRPRPPFQSPPPPPSTNCCHEELWSRGVQSLGAVTQLRVGLPFGGAASALGLKALSVWGQPAQCCRAEEVDRIRKAHEASERKASVPIIPPVCPPKQQKKTESSQSFSAPEEFLDPITQEIMVLPMLLPSGVSVDSSTLEEYQKREATWGRPPNDPFTSVPFTGSSQPLPNPQLKSRIDHFLLLKGEAGKDGRLGRKDEGKNPHPSRLVASEVDQKTLHSPLLNCEQTRKRDMHGSPKVSSERLDHQEKSDLPQSKRQRSIGVLESSSSSHEQRLSASLDEALSSALQGRPSFTSNLSLNKCLDTGPIHLPRHSQQSANTGETCSACSCSISLYSTPASPIYRLSCGHFLCRSCLQQQSPSSSSTRTLTTNHVSCLTCHSTTLRNDIMRVHH